VKAVGGNRTVDRGYTSAEIRTAIGCEIKPHATVRQWHERRVKRPCQARLHSFDNDRRSVRPGAPFVVGKAHSYTVKIAIVIFREMLEGTDEPTIPEPRKGRNARAFKRRQVLTSSVPVGLIHQDIVIPRAGTIAIWLSAGWLSEARECD